MQKIKRTDAKVGFMVIMGFSLLLAANWIINGLSFSSGGYAVTVVFQTLAGISTGSDVRLNAGIHIGKVEAIVIQDGMNFLTLRIQNEIRLNSAATAGITSSAILGEPFVSLSYPPGDFPELPEGTVIRGLDPVSMMDSISEIGRLIQNVNAVALQDPENINLEGIGSSISGGAKNFNSALAHLGSAAERLNTLMASLDQSGTKIQTLLDRLNTSAAAAERHLPSTLRNLESVAAELAKLTRQLGEGRNVASALLSDRELYYEMKLILENLKVFTFKLRQDPSILLWREPK